MCARCHGAKGEGTKKYAQPLIGDKSVAQLAAVIDRTMPEDDPDKLDAAGSKRVAEYIYDAFYSPAAQAEAEPAAHRTVAADGQAVPQRRRRPRSAASAAAARSSTTSTGCAANTSTPATSRTGRSSSTGSTPEVNFDFGKSGPESKDGKAKFDPHQFCIRWEGSVLAPETGEYEFVVRTDHATRLWVNDAEEAAHRRLGEVGQRHRVPRIDLPAGRPGLPAPAGVLQGQAGRGRLEEEPEPAREAAFDRRWSGSGRTGREVIAGALPDAVAIARGRRDRDALPAGRPQLRLGARHHDLEGVGRGHHRRRDRGRRATSRLASGTGRRAPTGAKDREAEVARLLPAGSPSVPSAGR